MKATPLDLLDDVHLGRMFATWHFIRFCPHVGWQTHETSITAITYRDEEIGPAQSTSEQA